MLPCHRRRLALRRSLSRLLSRHGGRARLRHGLWLRRHLVLRLHLQPRRLWRQRRQALVCEPRTPQRAGSSAHVNAERAGHELEAAGIIPAAAALQLLVSTFAISDSPSLMVRAYDWLARTSLTTVSSVTMMCWPNVTPGACSAE